MVTEQEWQKSLDSLQEWRKKRAALNVTGNPNLYKELVEKCFIGKNCLDVGCGSMAIKNVLPRNVAYNGIDALPIVDGVVKMKIEDCDYPDKIFETVYCFAVLDGVQDAEKALIEMKRVCGKNVVIFTGIDIPVDENHTHVITEELLHKVMHDGFYLSLKEQILPKVFLFEFTRH